MASRRLFDAVPFYAGLTLEEIGGRGVRWQERDAAASFPAGARRRRGRARAAELGDDPDVALRAREVAGFRSVWDAPEVEHSPALEFPASGRVARPCQPPVRSCAMIATVGYYEPWWIQILKAIVIFAVGLQLVPSCCSPSASCSGASRAATGPNRVGPYGALQPLADILKLLTKEQFRPDHLDRLPVRARADHLDRHRRRGASRSSRSATCRTSSARRSGCTGSTSRSARSTCSRSAASPSTGSCSAAGPRARSTRSSARCAAPRS